MSLSPNSRAHAFFQLTARIRIAHRAVLRAAEAIALEEGVSHGEVTLLACLDDAGGALTVPDIARIRRTTRQTIQATVDRVLDAGLVVFAPNPRHQRSKLVKPTKRGLRLLRAAQASAEASMREVAAPLNKSELEQAARTLERVVARLDEVHPPE